MFVHRWSDWVLQQVLEEDVFATEEEDEKRCEVKREIKRRSSLAEVAGEMVPDERIVVMGGWIGNISQSNLVFMESCDIAAAQIPDLPANISHSVGVVVPSPGNILFF